MKTELLRTDGKLIELDINPSTPFVKALLQNKSTHINDGVINSAVYGLIIHKNQVKMYNSGIKPSRNWKITQVKKFYGYKGRDNKSFVSYLNRILEKFEK